MRPTYPTFNPTDRPSPRPTFTGVTATTCQNGTYSYNGNWEICDVRDDEAWIQAVPPNVGNYDMLSICESLGYEDVYQRRSTCSYTRCGYCSSIYSCSDPESWSTMWPSNSYLWTSTNYVSGSYIAWVCKGIKINRDKVNYTRSVTRTTQGSFSVCFNLNHECWDPTINIKYLNIDYYSSYIYVC